MNQAIIIGRLTDIVEEKDYLKLVISDEHFNERFEVECHKNMADRSLYHLDSLIAVKCRMRNDNGIKLIAEKSSFISSE